MDTDEICAWLRANSSGIYRPAAEAADEIERLSARCEALRSVLRVIADQDPVELALDPQWCRRIAKGGLDATAGAPAAP